jgi:NTP pyrophosphatase (non-canonical NTP hydrolase)
MTYRQFLLVKLAEECAEVAHAALKQAQLGKDSTNFGKLPETNEEHLMSEFADVQAVFHILQEAGEVRFYEEHRLAEMVNIKRERIEKWLQHSRNIGLVE